VKTAVSTNDFTVLLLLNVTTNIYCLETLASSKIFDGFTP